MEGQTPSCCLMILSYRFRNAFKMLILITFIKFLKNLSLNQFLKHKTDFLKNLENQLKRKIDKIQKEIQQFILKTWKNWFSRNTYRKSSFSSDESRFWGPFVPKFFKGSFLFEKLKILPFWRSFVTKFIFSQNYFELLLLLLNQNF